LPSRKLRAVSDEETPAETPAASTEAPAQEIVSDEDILARIQAEFANRPQPRQVTVSELFQQGIALVASATGKTFRGGIPRVTEQTAVRVYELTLMWALNTRGNPGPAILDDEGVAEASAPVDLPTPDEIIGGDAEQE
jgi:hypothetical protein